MNFEVPSLTFRTEAAEYVAPTIGDGVPVGTVTLFSGSIDPDAGVVGFGEG